MWRIFKWWIYSIAALSSIDGLKVSVSCMLVAVITFMIVAFMVVVFMVAGT